MIPIYIDIESVPGQEPGLREAIAEAIQPPGTLKKAETIAAWEVNEKPQKIEEAYLKTALDGTYGELAVISWAIQDGDIFSVQRALGESEADMLASFYQQLEGLVNQRHRATGIQWVGHNVRKFDLRFLFQRSVILGVRPPIPVPHNVGPSSPAVYDTMEIWAGFNNYVKLDKLCKVLGIPGKAGMDGSLVYPAMLEGRVDEVAEYCRDDVMRVRKLHEKLTFMGVNIDSAQDDFSEEVA